MHYSLPSKLSNIVPRSAIDRDAKAIWKLAKPYMTDSLLSYDEMQQHVLARQIEQGLVTGLVCPYPVTFASTLVTGLMGQENKSHFLAGTMLIKPLDAYIWMLYIHKDWQGRGLGRWLLEAGVTELRSQGLSTITLRVPVESTAAGFYQHLGWQWLHTAVGGRHEVYQLALRKTLKIIRKPALKKM